MTTQTLDTPATATLPAAQYDRDMTAVLQSVHTLFIVGKTLRYAELEARIRMQMAMRKMDPDRYNTAESYAYQISGNLVKAGFTRIRDGVIEVLPKMQTYIGYLEHWKRQRGQADYLSALFDYTAGFDA
jgi:hypothetical protein